MINPVYNVTDEEIQSILKLKRWLLDNYEEGGHWIYETHADDEYLINIREQGLTRYMAELSETWTVIDDVCEDVRAAGR